MEKHLLIKLEDIEPSHPDFRVIGVFNPAVVKVNGHTIMLVRVAEMSRVYDDGHVMIPMYRNRQYSFIKIPADDPNYDFSDARVIRNHDQSYLSSISHFRVARSTDGINFTFDATPILPSSMYEEYGIEDPRITPIDGRYYITYTAVSTCGINVALMVTDDFVSFERLGIIFPFDNKDCVIFPKKINNAYYAYHRPSTSAFGKLDIWIAKSNNLIHWGEHEALISARITYGPSIRVGAGAVPLLTERGWVVIYHSADKYNRYHLAALLVDAHNPAKILMRSKRPLVEPSEFYEVQGFVPHVIFTCGLTTEGDGINIFYGACDEQVAMCHLRYDELFDNMEPLV